MIQSAALMLEKEVAQVQSSSNCRRPMSHPGCCCCCCCCRLDCCSQLWCFCLIAKKKMMVMSEFVLQLLRCCRDEHNFHSTEQLEWLFCSCVPSLSLRPCT